MSIENFSSTEVLDTTQRLSSKSGGTRNAGTAQVITFGIVKVKLMDYKDTLTIYRRRF